MSTSDSLALFSQKALVKLIRELFVIPRENKPCAVCGKYACITQAHHVIAVSQMASLCRLFGVTFEQLTTLKIPYMWLCPNHHAIFHKMNSRKCRTGAILECIDSDEFHSLEIMFDESYWREFNAFLMRCYDENHS